MDDDILLQMQELTQKMTRQNAWKEVRVTVKVSPYVEEIINGILDREGRRLMIKTALEAIDKSIEKWTYLAETGRVKHKPSEQYKGKCAFCEFSTEVDRSCTKCPWNKKFGRCGVDADYDKWKSASSSYRKKHAANIVTKLQELRRDYESNSPK